MISTLRNNNPNRRPSSSFYCYVEAQKLPLPKLITMQKQTEALTQRQARRAALNLICPGSANQKDYRSWPTSQQMLAANENAH
mmetsp:Transcript_33010/g.54623  ORF Transcript_33010/g.54623 Transcript_33010/m.54623 type:complete len:83 (+) Transcript_33010:267-515(+)